MLLFMRRKDIREEGGMPGLLGLAGVMATYRKESHPHVNDGFIGFII
jgi:hypothetical protein